MPSPLFPNFNKLIAAQKALEAKAAAAWKQVQNRRRQASAPAAAVNKPKTADSWLWRSILSKLGPVGEIVNAMLRPNGGRIAPDVEKEIEAAQTLLEAIGQKEPQQVEEPVVEPWKQVPNRRRSSKPLDTEPARPEPEEDVQPATGLVEGMIPCVSSNVHSFGWEFGETEGRGNLLVRFLGGDSKHREGPGALYRYFDLPRAIFDGFKRASSAGEYVRSELRIRGTISGHQYDFELAGTDASGYVPRQAGLKRGQSGEFFLKRTFQGRRSNLPEQQARGSRNALTQDFRGESKRITFRAGRRPT